MKKILYGLMVLCIVPIIVSCNGNERVSSQIANNETVSSESSILTNSASTTSENENNHKEEASTSNPFTSSAEKTSSNSSKNNTSVTTSNTNVTGKNSYKQATDSDNNVTVDSDGIVSITIPKWFLLKMEPDYNYQLTEKEANTYKFTSVTKNADGSATYKIGYNDYHGFF